MGMNVSSGSSRRQRQRLNSEINVTPFVDVMLVLLIIFMVTAPMIVSGVDVNLPEANKTPPISNQVEPLVVTITQKGTLYLMDNVIERETLVPKLLAVTKEKKDTVIYVRGDKNVMYGKIMEVFDSISGAGFTKVTLLLDTARKRGR